MWLKSACPDKDSSLPELTLCPTSKNRKHSPFLPSVLVGQSIASCPLIFCIQTFLLPGGFARAAILSKPAVKRFNQVGGCPQSFAG